MLILLVSLVGPASASAATCSDFSTQAAAQAAANTRDADGDGIYCESLPCPCSTGTAPAPSPSPAGPPPVMEPAPPPPATDPAPVAPPAEPPVAPESPTPATEPAPSVRKSARCARTSKVQPIGFSATKYPTIRSHYEAAVANGWPRVLVLNRKGAAARRTKLLRDIPTMAGADRDEYPPTVGRGRGSSMLRRGVAPIGWLADVAYVPSSENRSHGSTMGAKLRRFCDGQKFRYVFY